MSDTEAGLRRQIDRARDLRSVVRTMKALAASGMGQFEKSVRALADYHRTVELALGASLRESGTQAGPAEGGGLGGDAVPTGAMVFGSDQGLVGRFNEAVADCAIEALAACSGTLRVWAVGERVHARLTEAGLPVIGLFPVPVSVQAIVPLVGRLLLESGSPGDADGKTRLFVFHNRPVSGSLYEPACQRLLPLDEEWRRSLMQVPWPNRNPPEVMRGGAKTLRALIGEYLFITLFRACAESLASENGSRLAAMERADRNIGELLERLRGEFQRLRQSAIDEELFEVVAGFEALVQDPRKA